ncbi:MAG: hypothetical protein EBY26_07860, partial [Microbacteriaceae bacterium]|nr:hypothetical protein [Microbacteriaceae bacterium]
MSGPKTSNRAVTGNRLAGSKAAVEPMAVFQMDVYKNGSKKAYQCRLCKFGPIDHMACGDLGHHQGETTSGGGVVRNNCPRCGHFARRIEDFDLWDGTVPAETELLEERMGAGAKRSGMAPMSSAHITTAVEILYTFRKFTSKKMATEIAGDENYYAGNLDNPLLMCLVEGALFDNPNFKDVDAVRLINEELSRAVHVYLKIRKDGKDTVEGYGKAVASRIFGVPLRPSTDPDTSKFDFSKVDEWCAGILPSLDFSRRFKEMLHVRGGWPRLEEDMMRGKPYWQDVVAAMKT